MFSVQNCPADIVVLIDSSYREGILPGGPWDINIKEPSYAVIRALVRDNAPLNGNRIAGIRCANPASSGIFRART